MGEFDGLRAAVTGGASGIGAAVSLDLLGRGARVAVLDLDPAGAPDGSLPLGCDVADDASVGTAVAAVVDAFGGLDVVVSNAGIGATGTVEDGDLDEWRRVLDVNLLGTVRVVRAALPHLRRSPHASVVVTSSVVATVGLPQRALYTASKGALSALVRAMAADHVAEGVRVNAVLPGTADTPWIARLLAAAEDPDAERQALDARQPHGRLVTPQEVAAAVAYLASPLAGSTTGVELPVDGGLSSLRLRR